jgi:hypothetical protein
VDLATFWMARRVGLTATCAVAVLQCALVAAAVYVSALCGGLMGLFLDGAFSRYLLTGVFELDSFFPGAFVLSMRVFVIDWYPHGLRYLICTEYYYGKKCCLFTLWRSGREY